MTLNVEDNETIVRYIIRHDADAILSWRVSLELIAVDFRTHTDREDFLDNCLTIVTVAYATNPRVRVSLVWT